MRSAYAYAVRRPVVNSYLVRERDRRRLRELGLVLLLVLTLGGGLLGYTWIHLEVLRTGFRVSTSISWVSDRVRPVIGSTSPWASSRIRFFTMRSSRLW